jgi:Single-strand binding protein family
MNQVALVGNITDDPELRYTQSGATLAGFTVAVSHRSKTNGEWQDVNDGFFRCTAWRSVAENMPSRALPICTLCFRHHSADGSCPARPPAAGNSNATHIGPSRN